MAGLPGSMLAAVAAFLLLRAASAGVGPSSPDTITLAYVPGWAQNTSPGPKFFNTSAMNLTNVSHIAYAFLWIHEDCTVYDPFNNLPLLTELKSRWPATKLLVSIGGGGFSTTIWARAATTGLTTFVRSAVAAMKAANADGIDLDWEFPTASDRASFTALCAALRSRLDAEGAAAPGGPRRYWLTAAVNSIVAFDGMAGYDLAALRNTIDLFNIMTYTMHDPCYWETSTNFHTAWSDCVTALNYYISQGVPRTQLVLGLAFYGHVYTLTDPADYTYPAPSLESRDCSTMTTVYYRDILRELQLYGGGVFLNATQRSAYYVRGTRWIGFDIAESLAMKIQGSRDYGVGGVMVWDASLDQPDGELLRGVADRRPLSIRPCGGGFIGTGTCTDPSQCCSEFGYCGATDQFCGPRCRGGPCIAYPSPPPRPPAPPPSCGSGVVGSGLCADATLCCSAAGWCGSGADWCGTNCAGGPCWNKPRPPPPPPRPPPGVPPPAPPPVPYGCGGGDAGNGTCDDPRMCCSSFGYCGDSDDHCGYGCRGGPCQVLPPPSPGKGGPMCGNGVVGSGDCGYKSLCCSKFGYCGDTSDHCGPGCQGGACWLPPPPPSTHPNPPPPAPVPWGCGGGAVGNGTCPDPTDCCSSFGWCANTPTHCGYGCRGGPCTALPPAPPGPMCGGGVVGSGYCGYSGFCCSQFGYCGWTEEHCGEGCQGGDCWRPPPAPASNSSTVPRSPPSPSPSPSPSPPPPRRPSPSPRKPPSSPPPRRPSPPPRKPPSPPPPRPPPPSPKPPSPSPPPPRPPPPSPKPPSPKRPSPSPSPPPSTVVSSKPPPRPPPPRPPPPPPSPTSSSPNGTCGNGQVGNGQCPDPTQCCSSAGWCWNDEDHCYWACVGGPCWEPPPAPRLAGVTYPPDPPPPAPGTVYCGGGVVGVGVCRERHLCCSGAGWCAYDADHCSPSACVGGPCWTNTTTNTTTTTTPAGTGRRLLANTTP